MRTCATVHVSAQLCQRSESEARAKRQRGCSIAIFPRVLEIKMADEVIEVMIVVVFWLQLDTVTVVEVVIMVSVSILPSTTFNVTSIERMHFD